MSAGLSKLDGLRLKLQHEENKLNCNIEKLFCKNKLKEWATEQYKYSQSKLEVKNLLANVNIKYENLLTAKHRLCQVFKGIPEKSNRTRKVKENKRKAAKRKAQRLQSAIEELRSKLIQVHKK